MVRTMGGEDWLMTSPLHAVDHHIALVCRVPERSGQPEPDMDLAMPGQRRSDARQATRAPGVPDRFAGYRKLEGRRAVMEGDLQLVELLEKRQVQPGNGHRPQRPRLSADRDIDLLTDAIPNAAELDGPLKSVFDGRGHRRRARSCPACRPGGDRRDAGESNGRILGEMRVDPLGAGACLLAYQASRQARRFADSKAPGSSWRSLEGDAPWFVWSRANRPRRSCRRASR